MKTIEVTTNIMCGSCVAKVTPVLNKELGEGNWKVDTLSLNKTLAVTSENLDRSQVVEAVQKAGYKAN